MSRGRFAWLLESPGQCRWCGCTYDTPCPEGCGWANRAQTLCTACLPLDRALHTVSGRRELAEFLQEHEFLTGAGSSGDFTEGGLYGRRRRARAGDRRARGRA
jgi:hypothetical protein